MSSTSSAPRTQALLTGGTERRNWVSARRGAALWPLALYATLSLILFGLPVIGHLGSRIVAADQFDSSAVIWMLAWWPHALLHGLNPFVTYQQFYPNGFNLQWTTSVPLEAFVLTPVTLGFGPAVSWNLLQLLAPALSAWTAFLLCHHVTKKTGPALVGGYLFGFSPYMLLQVAGAPSLAMVALVPVFGLLVLKLIDGSIGSRAFVVAMALAIAAQYLTSGEVLAGSALFGGFAILAASVLLPDLRPALGRAVGLLALAFAGAAVLVSPFLYYFLFGPHYPPGNTGYEADLVSFVLPPELVALQLHSGPPYVGSNPEGYLGLPLLVLAAELVWRRRRSRAVLLTALCAVVAAIASLGRELIVRGDHTSIWLPWRLFTQIPVLRYAIPVRFGLFVILPIAVIAAVALSERQSAAGRRPQALRWVLAAAAIAVVFPAVGNAAWNTPINDPPFFADSIYRHYLRSDDHVLTVPAWGPNERWVADAGFPFSLSAGYLGNPFPSSYTRYPTWNTLLTGRLTHGYAAQLRQFLAAKRVTAIVVQSGLPGPWRTLFGTLHVRPIQTGGVLVYRLRSPT